MDDHDHANGMSAGIHEQEQEQEHEQEQEQEQENVNASAGVTDIENEAEEDTNQNDVNPITVITDGDSLQESAIEDRDTNTPMTLTSLPGPIANLCSATLGAGILSIPYSLYQSGIVVGMIMLVLSAVATTISIDMIIKATRTLKAKTYEQLVGLALGSRARNMTEFAILLFCEGVCVAYIIAVGDILGLLLGGKYRTVGMILSWAFTMLPLSLLRTMESLQWASSVGIISICLLLVAALQHAIQHQSTEDDFGPDLLKVLWPANGVTSVLCALPMILFAFSCQVNVCAIYDELDHKTDMKWITRGAVAICSALYSCIAFTALWDFGTSVQGNILLNYNIQTASALVHAAFASMATAVVMAFPLNVFPSRTALEGMWSQCCCCNESRVGGVHHDAEQPLLAPSESDEESASAIETQEENSTVGLVRHIASTILIAGSALAFALVVPNISVVFGLIGGTVSSLLGFVLPGALGIVTGNRPLGWFMVVCGSIVGIVTTAVTIATM